MKRSFLLIGLAVVTLFFVPTKGIKAQYLWCPNLNFSHGTLQNWQCYSGSCAGGIYWVTPTPPDSGRHTIMSMQVLEQNGQLYDEYCNVIKKVPDRLYSCRLGNNTAGTKADAIEYTITVDSSNSLLIISYTLVMQRCTANSPPQFTIKVTDSTGNILNISCAELNFIAEDSMGNLACDTNSLVARDWTTVGYSLESFIGQTIKIYFEVRDCALGCHFGYAYVTAECRPMQIELHYCPSMVFSRMVAPEGFASYEWTRSGDTSWKAYGQRVAPPYYLMADGEIITITLTSKDGCQSQVKVVIKMTDFDVDFMFGVKDTNGHVDFAAHDNKNWYDTCTNTVTFVDLSTVRNSKKDKILWEIMDPDDKSGKGVLWASTDSLFTRIFPVKDTTITYRVRLTVYTENGCMDTSSQTITIYPPIIRPVIADFTSIKHEFSCNDASKTVQFINQSQGGIVQYVWNFGNPKSGSNNVSYVENPVHTYQNIGGYDVLLVVTDTNGCADSLLKKNYVKILGPKGSFTYEEVTDCKPLSVDFRPNVDIDDTDYFPDSLMVITGDGRLLKAKDNNITRKINYKYLNGGAYLPTYYLYKTITLNGKTELCIAQINETDTIYVVDLQPNFDIEPYQIYLLNEPITFNNTGTWIPDYLPLDSLVWNFGNGNSSTDFNGSTIYNTEGGYFVNLTMKVLGCVKNKIVPIEVLKDVDIKQLTINNEQLTIYPNPTTGQLTIKNEKITIKNVEIYDIIGQVVGAYCIRPEATETIIDISYLANGIYFIKINNKITKIIKY